MAVNARLQVLNLSEEDNDELKITPLGSGQEVGRSCHYVEFKGKKILLDFGIHPALTGMSALPFVDLIDPEQIDLLLISHFHLDHAGGLPWFLMRTRFKGKCFMTHPTKAIYKWLLSDYIKVSNIATEHMLYTESDLDASLNKISVLNYHEEREVNGIKFWCYHAGHVLGAAMFMIQIAGVKLLYTGDFSRAEDRHLMVAEVPQIRPDVLIIESTYGVSIHEPRENREARFTSTVQNIVTRGGRCLIPVFALGRAQELLLILDEYWQQHPELHEVPIYYASALAKKCMSVYQTYTHAMNERIQRQIAVRNPFHFKHISYLKGIDQFEDVGPCVIMASPGMMQSGLSRDLFETWCTDAKNGVIIAGYCVEGTLAKDILQEPSEITTMSGQRLPLKCTVEYISFSAHTDYEQTSDFIRTIRPPNIVLVHGEMTEMSRLKSALEREYECDFENPLKVFNPKNLETVVFHFKGEKMAKVMGELAIKKPTEGSILSGILVKKNFNCHIISPNELGKFCELTTSTISQRSSLHYTGSWQLIHYLLSSMYGCVEVILSESDESKSLRVFNVISVIYEPPVIVLEWSANPTSDMYADAIMKVILKAQEINDPDFCMPPTTTSFDKMHFKECLIELLQEMFGEESVPKIFKGEKLYVDVNNVRANIDLSSMVYKLLPYQGLSFLARAVTLMLRHTYIPAELMQSVQCESERLQQVVQTAISKLYESLSPVATSLK